MKKKIIALVLILSMIMALSGCSGIDALKKVAGFLGGGGTSSVETPLPSVEQPGPTLSVPEVLPEPETESETKTAWGSVKALYFYLNGTVSVYDESNNLVDLIIPDAEDNARGYCSYENAVYFYRTYSPTEGAYNVEILKLCDGVETSMDIIVGDTSMYVTSLKVYNGYLFVTMYDSKTYCDVEYAYDLSTGEYDSGISDAHSELLASLASQDGYVCMWSSLAQCLAESGYVIRRDNNTYYMTDGTRNEAIDFTPEGIYVSSALCYDENYIFFSGYDEDDYMHTHMYCYDINSGKSEMIVEDYYSYLGFNNGSIYYVVEMNGNEIPYGKEIYVLYKYNPASGLKKLVSRTKTAGLFSFTPFVYGFTIIGDEAYCPINDDTSVYWYRVDGADEAAPEKIDDEIYGALYLDMGSVGSMNKKSFCDDCGRPLFKVYEEYFQINPDLSDRADKINEQLKSWVEVDVENEINNSYPSENCDEHAYEYSCGTYEQNLDYVVRISDKYLAVMYTGYWYGGGVHGMPVQDAILINLETGGFDSIADLYPGTEEELKVFVATKTAEDYLTYDYEGSPYFGDSYEIIYQNAYELINFDYFPVLYHEDYLYVSYPPYAMGPYASGYIQVKISYEDLGIKEALGIE